MARLKGRDNLNGLKGKASGDFRAATLAALRLGLFAAAGAARKNDAAQTLEHFYQAAQGLKSSESEFNRRARPFRDAPSLLANLRDPAQLAALRTFNSVKEKLLDIGPRARQIVRLVEKDIAAPW